MSVHSGVFNRQAGKLLASPSWLPYQNDRRLLGAPMACVLVWSSEGAQSFLTTLLRRPWCIASVGMPRCLAHSSQVAVPWNEAEGLSREYDKIILTSANADVS